MTEPKRKPVPQADELKAIKAEAMKRHQERRAKALPSKYSKCLEIVAEERGYMDWHEACRVART